MDKEIRYKKRARKQSVRRLILAATAALFAGIIGGVCTLYSDKLLAPKAETLLADTKTYALSPSSPHRSLQSIVIDAGHGGKDPGSVFEDIYESNINLEIAKEVAALLKSRSYQVIMTREGDVNVSLKERVDVANKSNADLFISIHQNSLKNDTVIHGMETWYNDRMNKASGKFAEYIQQEVASVTQAKNRGLRANQSLIVLKGVSMPACLIETGFITNPQERKLLLSAAYRKQVAQGIVSAIDKYFGNKQETISSSPSDTLPVDANMEPVPLSGKYLDMVVGKRAFVDLKAGDKIVYLTIDDGPCDSTPRLLEVLDRYDVKATFFVTAQYLSEDQIVKQLGQISARGHAVAVHTYSHQYGSIYQSVDSYLKDYKKMDDLIVKATGKRSPLFRFPGGSNTGYNKKIRAELISEMNSRGLIYHDWNAFNGDTDGLIKEQMISKAVTESSYKNKSVLLIHDTPGKKDVIDTLPSIILKLREKGYRFDVLDETVKPIQFESVQK